MKPRDGSELTFSPSRRQKLRAVRAVQQKIQEVSEQSRRQSGWYDDGWMQTVVARGARNGSARTTAHSTRRDQQRYARIGFAKRRARM